MNEHSKAQPRRTGTAEKSAVVYRMVMEKHICPWGLKTIFLLRRERYRIDDQWLETRQQVDDFKTRYDVKTTPQTFIEGQRIGGYDDLRRFLGKKVKDPEASTYKPVLAIFAMGAALALAVSWFATGALVTTSAIQLFISLSMCLLAVQKLRDVDSFATMFLSYDLLARRWVPYAYFYPFGEGLAGVLMTAHVLRWLSVPIALFIGTIGAISVFYAVYIQKRELKCACVGGNSNVPLGFVSLTENVMMVLMGLWILLA
ncbi:glutaredoxin [Novosphingobium profundi]|uniref:MauE/DoxX family redox-associated membrane protein n=1 Tax=Novosphingobium profundi TaxID=1774954 RepID=UPI001BD97AD6|nr:MauE/DoxX family redox-associated membrane protein [Novosphingobium profundi]MBT0668634.1 glutaredoxin [Novosphingobium profundi]